MLGGGKEVKKLRQYPYCLCAGMYWGGRDILHAHNRFVASSTVSEVRGRGILPAHNPIVRHSKNKLLIPSTTINL